MSDRKYVEPRTEMVDQLVDELFTFLDKRGKEIGANLTEVHSATFSVAVKMSQHIIRIASNPTSAQINRYNIAKRYMDIADDMTICGTSIH